MGNQNVISVKQAKELMKQVSAYINNGAPAKAIAAECGINWDLFQHYLNGDSHKRMLKLTHKKLVAWLDAHDEYMPEEWKRCTKCGKAKPLSEFHKDNSKKDSHRSACAECTRRWKSKRRMEKGADMANNNAETAITAEIVAPFFGITPKQLNDIRKGDWDSLLYKKESPKPASDVKNAVEALRVEIADMHSALNKLMVEMGCTVTEKPDK